MDQHVHSDWKTDKTELLPDFIIGGAMKSGTSTLHAILNNHPDIFIPEGEIHFFDIDSLFQHREFNFPNPDSGKWTYEMVQENPQKVWDWYLSHFEGKQELTTGEDSTTYLASKMAARRIAAQDKEIKLIFLLRHPTSRTYSQYLHLLRSGRAIYSFENMIKNQPEFLLKRSLYKEQLENYYNFFPASQIWVVLFEDFIRDPKNTVTRICDFLNLDTGKFDDKIFQLHTNKARLPKFIRLQIYYNRLYRVFGCFSKPGALPDSPLHENQEISWWGKVMEKTHRSINPLSRDSKPPLKESTRKFLDQYFFNNLQGIDELTDKDVLSWWFPELMDEVKNQHHKSKS